MKKFITMVLTLLTVLSASSSSIFAEGNSSTINTDGGSSNIGVSTSETVTNNAATDEDVFKVTVGWSSTNAVYGRTDKYTWDTDSLNYVLKDENKGTASVTPATTTITITNYSNTAVDYDITFTSKQVNSKDIATEAKASDSTADKTGTIASADQAGEIQQTVTNTAKQAVYKGSISYITDNYVPAAGGNTEMGTYTVIISKAATLTLDKSTLSLRAGKTATLNANMTDVTWSTSDSNVATVSNGTVNAIAAGTATITATASNGKTATCTVTVKPAAYQFNTFDNTWNDTWKNTLLSSNTVTFEYNNKNYIAYNGFIGETAYATWYNALDFVAGLNNAQIAPSGKTYGTDGKWILLETEAMAQAWALETKAAIGDDTTGYAFIDYYGAFDGATVLWSSVASNTASNHALGFGISGGIWKNYYVLNSNSTDSFVVIWGPAN